jgi:hypothetical protein
VSNQIPDNLRVRNIDNSHRWAPFATTLLIVIMILLGIWFFRGGSFRLYASAFFGLYFLTHLAWLSIILVSVVQNIILLPLRIIGERYWSSIKDFEHELTKTREEDQYILMNKKVREGDPSLVFYIVNFVTLAIAFISAGRVFLLEFYHTKISTSFLYHFIPYPDYPLQGTIFKFPILHITKTYALGWNVIINIILVCVAVMIVLRLIWNLVRFFLSKNKKILSARINYNRLLLFISSVIGTFAIIAVLVLRHLPVAAEITIWSADLSKQNTTFNIITAVATFFAAIYSGYKHHHEASVDANAIGIPDDIIATVFKRNMQISVRNGVLLAVFAYYVTHMLPCSHDLSVLTFETLYVLSPVTFDLLIPKKKKLPPPVVEPASPVLPQ